MITKVKKKKKKTTTTTKGGGACAASALPSNGFGAAEFHEEVILKNAQTSLRLSLSLSVSLFFDLFRFRSFLFPGLGCGVFHFC